MRCRTIIPDLQLAYFLSILTNTQLDDFSSILTDTQLANFSCSVEWSLLIYNLTTPHQSSLIHNLTASHLIQNNSPDLQLSYFSSILTDTKLDDYSSSPGFHVPCLAFEHDANPTCKYQSFSCPPDQSPQLNNTWAPELLEYVILIFPSISEHDTSLMHEHQCFLCPLDWSS